MSLEVHGWYSDLKYGTLIPKVCWMVSYCKILVRILAFELAGLGSVGIMSVYLLKNRAGVTIIRMFSVLSEDWELASSLENINQNNSLSSIMESTMNSFCLVTATGVICFIVGFWFSRRADYVCSCILLTCLIIQAREMKQFDNILSPIQNRTMLKLRGTIFEDEFDLPVDYIATLDMLMFKAQCCGIVSGEDMKLLSDDTRDEILSRWKTRSRQKSKEHNRPVSGPVSPCWNKRYSGEGDVGCYVHYFGSFIQPYTRCMHGLAIITEIIMVALITLPTDLPTTPDDALKLVYFDRKPTQFSID